MTVKAHFLSVKLKNHRTGKIYDILAGETPEAYEGDPLTSYSTVQNIGDQDGLVREDVYLNDTYYTGITNVGLAAGGI